MARWAAIKRLSADRRTWAWVILACVIVAVAVVRFRLREMPLERDEGEYAYGGQLLLQGYWPGQHLYTMKLPGTHAAYAVLMALFGQSVSGVHLGFLAANCITIVLVFLLARKLCGLVAATVAATTYALMSLSPDTLGTAAHATHFVVLFAIGGLVLLLRAAEIGSALAYFAAAFLLSMSVLMKHNGVFFVVVGAAWVARLAWTNSLGQDLARWKALAGFCLGLIVPFLLLLVVLWGARTLETQWLWSVSYARAYSQPNPGLSLIWRMMLQRMPGVLELPWLAAFPALALLWVRRCDRALALCATTFFLFSWLAVLPGFHFRSHYYVLLMPALSLLAGVLVQRGTEGLRALRLTAIGWAPAAVFVFFLARAIAAEGQFLFHLSPTEASRSLYGSALFSQTEVLGKWIREHSPPQARVAVLGSEPEIFFYAHRVSATGFIYTYPLTERQPFASEMRAQMKQETANAQPLYVVQVRPWTSWQPRPGSPQRLAELRETLTPPGYQVIGQCTFDAEGTGAAWLWYRDAPKPIEAAKGDLVILEDSKPPR